MRHFFVYLFMFSQKIWTLSRGICLLIILLTGLIPNGGLVCEPYLYRKHLK